MAYINGKEVLFESDVDITVRECEQEGIFEVVRDETCPAVKIGSDLKIGVGWNDDYLPAFIDLPNQNRPRIYVRTKNGVPIIQIQPSELIFMTGNYGNIGQQGNKDFILSLLAGKVRANNTVATDNTFAVGWEDPMALHEGKDYNPFEVIADYSTGECGIKVGQTEMTEEQLKSMLSILTNNLNEVMF